MESAFPPGYQTTFSEQALTVHPGPAALAHAQRYRTSLGAAYHGDALELLPALPDASVQAIITSPPFALTKKKRYGNPSEDEYLAWFRQFIPEFRRVLKNDGSLVVELGGVWLPGSPTRSVYQFELLISLVRDEAFFLAEEFYWYNRTKLPSPAQWVTVERIRVKDAVTMILWLSKTDRPKASNWRVLKPYGKDMRELLGRGRKPRGRQPSGHVFDGEFRDNGGAIPPNLIESSNARSSDSYQVFCRKYGYTIHPARFPREVPEFFVKFVTEPGDVVLDPFSGSNMTGAVAEHYGRCWLAFEKSLEYVDSSIGRFVTVALEAT